MKEVFSGEVFFTIKQSNKYNTFTAVFIFMTNTQNLKGVQRSKKAWFDQYLCNILSSSTEIKKKHKHNILFFLKEIIRVFTFKQK